MMMAGLSGVPGQLGNITFGAAAAARTMDMNSEYVSS
jgi:hypothetical protein